MRAPATHDASAATTGRRRLRPAPRRSAGLASGALVAALLCTAPWSASASPLHAAAITRTAVPAIDTSSRASVSAAYRKVLLPALSTAVRWSGSVKGCRTGSNPAATKRAVTRTVDFVRALDHLPNVRYDATASNAVLRAALVMQANGRLSHEPKRDGLTKCLTAAANTAAGRSNLTLGSVPAGSSRWSNTWSGRGAGRAVLDYMTDDGADNTAVGHRTWLLSRGLTTIASGTTTAANALRVIDPKASAPAATTWRAWPSSGWFPTQLEPDGRWSLSAPSAPGAFDLSGAAVRVARGTTRLAVHVYRGAQAASAGTLSWQVRGVHPVAGTKVADYTVTVSRIRDLTTKHLITRTYRVQVFNPWAAPAPTRLVLDHDRLTAGSVAFDFFLQARGQTLLGGEHVTISVDGHHATTAKSPAGSVVLNESARVHRVRFSFSGSAYEHAASKTVSVRF